MAKKKQIINVGDDKQYLAGAFPVERGSKGALVSHMMKSMALAKETDTTDVNSMLQTLEAYLALCAANDVNVTNTGVYGALGLGPNTISQWANGKGRGSDPKFKEFALMVKRICAQYRELAASEGKLNVSLAIWWQKNYDGFRDVPEIEKESTVVDRPADPEEISKKYQHVLHDDSGARMEVERERRSVNAVPIYEEEDEDDNS